MRGLAGTSANTESSQDSEISSQMADGCCSEGCYQQFIPQEILDFKLCMKELSNGERDVFLMEKLQVSICDSKLSLMYNHERQLKGKEWAASMLLIIGLCVRVLFATFTR